MSDFIEAVLVFGLGGFVFCGGFAAGVLVLIVRFFDKESAEKLIERYQQLMGIFGLVGCFVIYLLFYT